MNVMIGHAKVALEDDDAGAVGEGGDVGVEGRAAVNAGSVNDVQLASGCYNGAAGVDNGQLDVGVDAKGIVILPDHHGRTIRAPGHGRV